MIGLARRLQLCALNLPAHFVRMIETLIACISHPYRATATWYPKLLCYFTPNGVICLLGRIERPSSDVL